MKTKHKTKKAPKTTKRTTKKPKLKKVASLGKGIDIVQKQDGTLIVSGKNAKALEGAVVEQHEREYKFDDRLVPYYWAADTKEGNLSIRDALIKLGKTPAMTELFSAMKNGNLTYREDGKEILIKGLLAIINGHDGQGLLHVHETDIELIHANNLKLFNEYWDAKARIFLDDEQFAGFDN